MGCQAGRMTSFAVLAMVLALTLGIVALEQNKTGPPIGGKGPALLEGGLCFNDPKAFRGYTLFSPLINCTKVFLIDMEGRVAHMWKGASTPAGCAFLLENGHLLRPCFFEYKNAPFGPGGGAGGRVQEFTWDGELVWDFQLANEKQLSHHDVRKLPNGNLLMIVGEIKDSPEVADAGREPPTNTRVDCIMEVQPTGKTTGEIVWQWHIWDHLVQDVDKSKGNFGEVAAHPELIDANFGPNYGSASGGKTAKGGGQPWDGSVDWTHTNSVDYCPEFDQILLSVHNFSEVWIIDHSTTTAEASGHTGGTSGKGGDLLYRWGNPRAYRAGTAADRQLFSQHSAHWITKGLPGEGHVFVFNNGDSPPGRPSSSVDEFILPVDAKGSYAYKRAAAYGPEKALWSYFAPNKSDFYAKYVSGAQRLPNGNTLICSGVDGLFFEVNSAREVLWKYVNPVRHGPGTGKVGPGAVFRAYRYAPDYPGLGGRHLNAAKTIEELLLKEVPY